MPPTVPPAKSRTEELLLRPAGKPLERLIGVVCLCIGVALSALTVWLLAAASDRGPLPLVAWLFLLLFVSLAVLFLNLGYRLALNRANEFGSLLSPRFFAGFAFLCLVLAAYGVALAIVNRDYLLGQGIVCALLLALLSYGAACHFKRRK